MNPDGLGQGLPTLPGRAFCFRWMGEADLPELQEIFGDADVVRFMALSCLTNRKQTQRFLNSILQGFASGTLYQWGLEYRGRIIGSCTLAAIDRSHRRAEIGFALARRFQGRGLMAEAVPLVLDFAFKQLALHRVEADVDPRNKASLALLEKLGFRREGLLRERFTDEEGFQDSLMLGLLSREWCNANRPAASGG
ncbi:GNAT family N-acetyltransferase [Microbulbifer discodermiae]|uniref:GNAT family N-acetyltransferase n=1 Tax=Microbulbifer sp. 2201CG32-9 TaxID=3232309 RepID=UPI00345C4F42